LCAHQPCRPRCQSGPWGIALFTVGETGTLPRDIPDNSGRQMTRTRPPAPATDPTSEPALTTLGGRNILFVMADLAEYGPHLQQRFTPLITGIGPVEAAVQLTAALAGLAQRKSLPDLVVSLGSAGSRVLEQTSIYQATSVAYRD